MSGFDYEKIKDPGFFMENRMEAHSDHVAYASRKEAYYLKKTSFRESLNGLWKFHYAKNYGSVIPDFEKDSYNTEGWDDIRVPAHMQMEGYDVPQYANIQYPWDGRDAILPGEIPSYFNPVGSYVKHFQVPQRMEGKPLFISFQGVESAFALWLNGRYVGYSGDSFTPSEFDLSPYVRAGENKLALQVFKWTAGSWLEDQDFFRFSGIFRDVYLYTEPEHHVKDLKLEPVLNEDFTQGTLKVSIKGKGWGGSVSLALKKGGQEMAFGEFSWEDELEAALSLDHPDLWSAESPSLYDLEITVMNEEGLVEEFIPEKVGFRRFELDGNLMKLNGKRIVFKGVNRHEFCCDTGRVLSEEEVRRDLIIMKQNNINAIRTCHYPDASFIYSLADELGLYMIDECNMETHGSWDPVVRKIAPDSLVVPSNHMEYLDMMLDRIRSMYQRDKNHTAVLIWSLGNESFGGDVIYEMSRELHRLDSSRLVHYEGIFSDRRHNDTSDIESQMYPPVEKIKAFLKEHPEKPFICCEYIHAMGNSCGAMHKYTDLTEEEPLFQGGFIWDFVDQSIRKKDRYGKEFQAYGGDHGERPTDYNFSGNGILDGERRISPKMQEVKYNYQNISVQVERDSFTVKNKNLFVHTATFECRVTLLKNGREEAKAQVETDTAPLSSATYSMPDEITSWLEQHLPGEYVVTVSFHLKEDTLWASRGHEVAFGQGVFREEEAEKLPEDPFTLVMGTYNVGIRGEHFEALFSRLNGGLVSYKFGGKEMIEAIPKPNFWRAPTDNDCGNQMAARYGQWKLASLYATHYNPENPEDNGRLVNPRVEKLAHSVKVTYTYYMPTIPASQCTLCYEVFGNGAIRTTLSYDPSEGLSPMPEFGVLFKLNADYANMEWYGLGPDDCYNDREKGARLGIHRKTVEENVAHYLVPQESGNHTGIRWIKILNHKGRGMVFAGDKVEACVSPYTPHELENAMHSYELPPVHYTVVRIGCQMGVGGDDSWGAKTHEEYLIHNEKRTLTFWMKGI